MSAKRARDPKRSRLQDVPPGELAALPAIMAGLAAKADRLAACVPTVLECDLAKLDELAKANPGQTMRQLLRGYALWEIIDEDDAATGYREPGEDDES